MILSLVKAPITDAGLAHLRRPELPEMATLSSTQITDAGLAALDDFPQLEMVDVGFTGVGDPGIAALAKLPKLKSLNVLMTKVTDEGVKAAKAAHPGLTVMGPQLPKARWSSAVASAVSLVRLDPIQESLTR